MAETTNTAVVTVTVKTRNGEESVLTGETAIVFTVSKANEFMEGKAKELEAALGFIGLEIPKTIFVNTIGSLVGNVIQNYYKEDPVEASYICFTLSEFLQRYSDILLADIPEEEQKDSLMKWAGRELASIMGELMDDMK